MDVPIPMSPQIPNVNKYTYVRNTPSRSDPVGERYGYCPVLSAVRIDDGSSVVVVSVEARIYDSTISDYMYAKLRSMLNVYSILPQ